jgi:hypothetical protein
MMRAFLDLGYPDGPPFPSERGSNGGGEPTRRTALEKAPTCPLWRPLHKVIHEASMESCAHLRDDDDIFSLFPSVFPLPLTFSGSRLSVTKAGVGGATSAMEHGPPPSPPGRVTLAPSDNAS